MINQTRVQASASVDMIKFGHPPTWEVNVWGEPPHAHRRTYVIRAKDDNAAAFDGIAQFVAEMENLESAEKDD
jgi:hypothetical protein